MKVSIDTVAKKAGVSKATVSRFLNGKHEHMSSKTHEKIAGVISDLNYEPRIYAKKVTPIDSGKGVILLVASGITANPEFICGVFMGAKNLDYHVVMVKRLLPRLKVDGVIITKDEVTFPAHDYNPMPQKKDTPSSPQITDKSPEGDVHPPGAKFVRIIPAKLHTGLDYDSLQKYMQDTAHQGECTVYIDYFCGLKKAVAYFCDHHIDTFSHFTVDDDTSDMFDKALTDVLGGLSYELDDTSHIPKNSYKTCISELTGLVMRNRGKKVAVFVHSEILMCFFYALQQLKLRVPEEIGVCVYGTPDSTPDLPNGVSFLELPYFEAGAECVGLFEMAQSIKNKKNPSTQTQRGQWLVKTHLILLHSKASRHLNQNSMGQKLSYNHLPPHNVCCIRRILSRCLKNLLKKSDKEIIALSGRVYLFVLH